MVYGGVEHVKDGLEFEGVIISSGMDGECWLAEQLRNTRNGAVTRVT